MTEKPALLIIDMVKDNFENRDHLPFSVLGRAIIEPINRLSGQFRERGWPVVFPTDAFHEEDFIFTGKMKPHSLAGTPGAEVISELHRGEDDYWLPKPRFSAFFETGLEHWLRRRQVTLCAVAGIATHFCVLTTIMDALSHDFKAVLLEDCTAAASEPIHRNICDTYRRNAIYPLLRVLTSDELKSEWGLRRTT